MMKTYKAILVFAFALLATATANAQKISAMTKITNVWSSAQFEISATNGGGGWMTRAIALSNIFNAPEINAPFLMGDFVTFQTTNANPAKITFSSTIHNGNGVLQLGSSSGDVVINPSTSGVLQIGRSGNAGTRHYMQYAQIPTVAQPLGFSHPLEFRSLSRNGGSTSFKYPGIVGFAEFDSNDERGQLRFFTRAPTWSEGNLDPNNPNTPGVEVGRMRTNGWSFFGDTTNTWNVWISTNSNAQEHNSSIKAKIGQAQYWPGAGGLDVSFGSFEAITLGGDLTSWNRTSGTSKYSGISLVPVNHANPMIAIGVFSATGSGALLNWGGGTGARAPVTEHAFYTGANSTTAGAGNLQLRIQNGATTVSSAQFIVSSPTVPASATASGTAGSIAWDANYIYVCTAANTWKRTAIATW